MLISLSEIIAIIVITIYLAYVFSGFISRIPLRKLSLKETLKISAIITAPAVILHELSHKFVAMLFGYQATFYAFYQTMPTLILAIISIGLRFINAPFIFIIPGFVGIPPTTSPLETSIIAFAGPFMNLLLYLIAILIIKTRNLNRKQLIIAHLTKRINIFLFLFNMIPIGFFDGQKVFSGLFAFFLSHGFF